MFHEFSLDDDTLPEPDLSDGRVAELIGDIKRNSRNRRIAMVAPLVLAAAVLGAMLAAPPQHGGLTDVADAEGPDPRLPRVFGSNGVWALAEPIQDAPADDAGPADMIQVPTEPSSPAFVLAPPSADDTSSLPTSTSTPPMSTSGQDPIGNPSTELDWSDVQPRIRIAPESAAGEASTGEASTGEAPSDPVSADGAPDPDAKISTPAATSTHDNPSSDGHVTVAAPPQSEPTEDRPEANPSTPQAALDDNDVPPFSAPASIVPLSVPLVTGAHVSVSVQVVDDDSSVIDWCNTRVDWGDGSVTRAAGVGDAALCTASCEYESTSPASGSFDPQQPAATEPGQGGESVDAVLTFEHAYAATADVSPRIFVATGDGCSYTLAELQLPPFTVIPVR